MLESLEINEQAKLLLSVGHKGKNRPFSPIQVMQLLRKILGSGRKPDHKELVDTARRLGLRDSSMLSKFLALEKLPERLWPLVVWGTDPDCISFSVAAQIARLENDAQIDQLAQAAVEHGLTRDEVRSIVQIIKRRKNKTISVQKAVKEVVNMRPVIVHQLVYFGLFAEKLRDNYEDKQLQRSTRVGLSKVIDPKDILVVKVADGRFAIILSDCAFDKNSQITEFFSADALEGYISSVAKENIH